MTIGKFLSLLEKRALFFARLDKLGDPFEGSITRHENQIRQRLWKQFPGLHDTSPEIIESKIKNAIVNCWHMRNHESIAMWERYVEGSEGQKDNKRGTLLNK